jgi:hypothetical protein
MRDAINKDEGRSLAAAMRLGKSWDEVRGMIPGVDPAALDRGWKAWVLREAGVVEPEVVPEPVAEEPKKHPIKHKR